ncbi:MAG: hypothetical protein EKK39_04440 [Sphingobacteriales bacterium]|uniref:hypothetical protein n=1 Tax=Hydrotalea flava TaxID=714549 RepID=UPI000FBDA8AB|nr:hypothetical protein [Hydrotalea flava]RTL54366.1 MAG: hypothetical protein EKK39_04440 [Sphingobacteriales bacterium]
MAEKFGNGGCRVVYCIQKIPYRMATIPYQFISGTFNGLTFYVVNGRQLVRTKTSINQQRFNTDPAFEKLRQYSEWLKLASPMASAIYRQLPKQKGLQQRITGQLIQLLKKGVPLAVAVQRLMAANFPVQKPVQQQHAVVYTKPIDMVQGNATNALQQPTIVKRPWLFWKVHADMRT